MPEAGVREGRDQARPRIRVSGLIKRVHDNIATYGALRTGAMLLRKLAGRRASPVANDDAGLSFDARYGVDTNRLLNKADNALPEEELLQAESHVPTEPAIFLAAMRGAGIDHRDYHFVDIGCGLGRAMILAATLGFREVTGVELSTPICERAAKNLARYAARENPSLRYELVNASALEYEFPAGPLCVYVYKPFKEALFAKLLERLETAMRSDDRPVVLVSVLTYDRGLYDRHAPSLELVRDVEVGEPRHSWQVFKTRPGASREA